MPRAGPGVKRDNGGPVSSEAAVKPLPRRGRLGVIALLGACPDRARLHDRHDLDPGGGRRRSSTSTASPTPSELFGGMPQEGDRLGSSDAPVTIQVFNDLQCAAAARTSSHDPRLVEDYARPGDVKLLYRHYSIAQARSELGFYGAEAAAQQGTAGSTPTSSSATRARPSASGSIRTTWTRSPAAIEELNVREWQEDLEEQGAPAGRSSERLEGHESSAASWRSAPARR